MVHVHLSFRKMIVSPAFLSLVLRILTVRWPAVHLTPDFKMKLIGVITQEATQLIASPVSEIREF